MQLRIVSGRAQRAQITRRTVMRSSQLDRSNFGRYYAKEPAIALTETKHEIEGAGRCLEWIAIAHGDRWPNIV